MSNQQLNKRNAGNDINTSSNTSSKKSKHYNNTNDDNDSNSISTTSTSTFVTQDDLKQQLQDFQNQLLASLKQQLAPATPVHNTSVSSPVSSSNGTVNNGTVNNYSYGNQHPLFSPAAVRQHSSNIPINVSTLPIGVATAAVTEQIRTGPRTAGTDGIIWPGDYTQVTPLTDEILEPNLATDDHRAVWELTAPVPPISTATAWTTGDKGTVKLLQQLLALCELPYIPDTTLASLVLPTLAVNSTNATSTTSINDIIMYNWLQEVNNKLVLADCHKLVLNRWGAITGSINKLQGVVNNGNPITQAHVNGVHRWLHSAVSKLYVSLVAAAKIDTIVVPAVEAEAKAETAENNTNAANNIQHHHIKFIKGNVNYLWRRLASGYIKSNGGTTTDLINELQNITYKGDSSVSQSAVLQLVQDLQTHMQRRIIYGEPVNKQHITNVFTSLLPKEIVNQLDAATAAAVASGNDSSWESTVERVIELVNKYLLREKQTLDQQQRANYAIHQANLATATSNNTSSTNGCTICGRNSHSTNQHHSCSKCGRDHPIDRCRLDRTNTNTTTNGGPTTNSNRF